MTPTKSANTRRLETRERHNLKIHEIHETRNFTNFPKTGLHRIPKYRNTRRQQNGDLPGARGLSSKQMQPPESETPQKREEKVPGLKSAALRPLEKKTPRPLQNLLLL
jgi:hypothetical protein